MRILLTNDDGIGSLGLKALWDALEGEHEVWIVAPDRERSGSSHCISIKNPVRFHKVAKRQFACGGTPADCIYFSCLGALPEQPELVISGINLGLNIGTDIIYSGTAAAARQAALMAIPAVAISQGGFGPPCSFERGAKYLRENLELLVKLWDPEHFININIPSGSERRLETKITHPARRVYQEDFTRFQSPEEDMFYFRSGTASRDFDENSDGEAVAQGFVSISPVYIHPVNYEDHRTYRQEVFKTIA